MLQTASRCMEHNYNVRIFLIHLKQSEKQTQNKTRKLCQRTGSIHYSGSQPFQLRAPFKSQK